MNASGRLALAYVGEPGPWSLFFGTPTELKTKHTMEEILHHQKDGWNPTNNGMFTTYQLV